MVVLVVKFHQQIKLTDTDDSGFTLLEMLLVITLFTTIMTITVPINERVKESIATRDFFETFESDMLFMQNLSITKQTPLKLNIFPHDHFYEIREGGLGKLLFKRHYSSTIHIVLGTFHMPFSFNVSGTPIQPGSFTIHIKNKTYKLTFPFGKGRYYVAEQ